MVLKTLKMASEALPNQLEWPGVVEKAFEIAKTNLEIPYLSNQNKQSKIVEFPSNIGSLINVLNHTIQYFHKTLIVT